MDFGWELDSEGRRDVRVEWVWSWREFYGDSASSVMIKSSTIVLKTTNACLDILFIILSDEKCRNLKIKSI